MIKYKSRLSEQKYVFVLVEICNVFLEERFKIVE